MADAAHFAKRLSRRLDTITALTEQPVRLFFQDEARFGLHLPHYRRITARGSRAIQPIEPIYEYYWLYGAAEPLTGEAFFLEMSSLNADCFTAFLQSLSKAYPESLNVVVIDNAPAHISAAVKVPENVTLMSLPSYSPELNPVERLWLALRRQVDVFDLSVRTQLEALREHVAGHLCTMTCEQIQSLTRFGYIRDALGLAR